MARIRTIKPEFWTSEQVAECSTTARLLFIGLWNFCDDAGRHVGSPKRAKMEVFPGDNFTCEDVSELIAELIATGLIVQYRVDGRLYWQITGWKHQKIEKKTIKYPSPDDADDTTEFYADSAHSRHAVDDQSANECRPVDDHSPPEGSGEEGKGEEKEVDSYESTTPQTKVWEGDAFPLAGGRLYRLPIEALEKYQATYGWDIEPELRKCAQWCRDHKAERSKNGRGMQARITKWLNRVDDRRGSSQARASPQQQRSRQEMLADVLGEGD